MNTTPISWHCPRCGLTEGWSMAPTRHRIWVGISCSGCDLDYQVLVAHPEVGVLRCQAVYVAEDVIHIEPGE